MTLVSWGVPPAQVCKFWRKHLLLPFFLSCAPFTYVKIFKFMRICKDESVGIHASSCVNEPPWVSGKPVRSQFITWLWLFSGVCVCLFSSLFLNEWAQKTQTSVPHFLIYRFLSIALIALALSLSQSHKYTHVHTCEICRWGSLTYQQIP